MHKLLNGAEGTTRDRVEGGHVFWKAYGISDGELVIPFDFFIIMFADTVLLICSHPVTINCTDSNKAVIPVLLVFDIQSHGLAFLLPSTSQ